jgi:glycerophosphoryl diester phosphodiesterase
MEKQAIFNIQGHRGCRGLMPENTIPAMLNAIELGVVTLEMDVVITKDKQVILSHEPFFNHEITTKPDGTYVSEKEEKALNIYAMNYNDVMQYDIGLKPHPRFAKQQKVVVYKPKLEEVFDAVKKWCTTKKKKVPYFNIETKCMPITDNIYHPKPSIFVELLMDVVKEYKMEQYVTIQSFDFRSLQYVHKQYPTIFTAVLIEDTDKLTFADQIDKLGFTPNIYSPHYSLVNKELVKNCHQKNIQLIPWTVNDKKEIERLKALGVDGIISDYPNLFFE